MKDEVLYQPSLSEGNVHKTQSYNIGKLFYVAFFGGTIALTVLAIRNGRWLRVPSAVLNGMLLLGAAVFFAKMYFYYAYFHHQIQLDKQTVKYGARILDLILFGGYYALFKKKYYQHLLLHGTTVPMKKSAILWCIFSAVIELVFLSIILASVRELS